MKKSVLITALMALLILAFTAGTLVKSKTQSADTQHEYRAKYEALQSKFDQISKIDIQEYLKLKDQEARYKKAEEILGKILLIMLYDLGIHSSETQLQALKNYVADTQSKNMDVIITPADSQPTVKNGTSSTSMTSSSAMTAEWKKDTSKVLEISSPEEATEFLNKVKVDNLFDEMRNGTPMNPGQFNALQGHFVGAAKFWDPKQKPWSVELTFNGHLENGKYRGNHELILKQEGKQFSRSYGDIKDDSYMSISGDSQGIIIDAAGGDRFFQMYYFPKLNELYGLVYFKESISKFSPEGVVRLIKK